MLFVEKSGRAQIRSKNKLRVFMKLITKKSLSRTQLEKSLKLSATSVTRITEELIKENLIYEAGTDETPFGRKPILLKVVENSFYIVGIHIQRLSLSICVTNMAKEQVYHNKIKLNQISTTMKLENVFLSALVDMKKSTGIPNEKILGVGVAVRGVVSENEGVIIRFRDNITNVKIADIVKKEIGAYCYIKNNIIAEVEAKYIYGAKKMPSDFLYLFVEDGVGCSIVSDKHIVSGAKNLSGKIAHVEVEPNGQICSCGKKGHLESYVTQSAIINEYKLLTGKTCSFEDIVCSAQQNEKEAKQILDKAFFYLGKTLLMLILIANPSEVVLKGSIFDLYPDGVEWIKNYINDHVFLPILSDIKWKISGKSSANTEVLVINTVLQCALEKKM